MLVGLESILVRWKGFMAEEDTWESRENLENTKELVEEFEKEYGRDNQEVRKQERVEEDYWRGGFPGQYAASISNRPQAAVVPEKELR